MVAGVGGLALGSMIPRAGRRGAWGSAGVLDGPSSAIQNCQPNSRYRVHDGINLSPAPATSPAAPASWRIKRPHQRHVEGLTTNSA